jgi:UDP-glucuronate 4-epimerase
VASILVTGAAGFIGSRVATLLLEAGHTVVGVDNLNHAYDVRLKEWRLERLRRRPGFRFAQVDIADRAGLEAAWAAADGDAIAAVINLAARAGVRQSVEDPWLYFETNATGTLNLLEACRQRGVGKFVLASTSSLYGAGNPMPYREDADTSQPLSPYAASKKAAEALCYTYHYLHGLDVTIFRYFTVYGPAGRPDMSLFRLVQWISEGRPVTIYGDGRQSRDFTFVDDIARGTVLGLQPLGYEVINLGSDRPVVLLDAVRLVEDLTGQKANLDFQPRHKADVPATWADISKARQLLGWQPQTEFAAGVQALVSWYQRERAWASQIVTG